ncbi:MAG: metalloregulator ArsR/SmtB family transcription factor [Deltaproteobacteria bacterium]|nr:metalloregulator ArsR/SmtB family transcription factor [Deltaproteobacteria bacterium]
MVSTALKYEDDEALDVVFGALADRTRRRILARLAVGPERVTDLAEPFTMSLPAVSKHLKVLERAGLIRRDVEGRIHRCSLGPEPLADARAWLDHYRYFWESTLDRLAVYVEPKANRQPKGKGSKK